MKILLVDDEQEFIKILTVAFQVYRPGYTLIAAFTGTEALARAEAEDPDLVVLDVMLPDIDGFEVCRRLRARADIPIILLTAKDREEDVVKGFELGADDYITKPFSYRTLMARIDSLLRRTSTMPGAQRPGLLCWGDLTFDFGQRQVKLRGKSMDLTAKEYRILEELARNAGQMVSHRTLLARIWGEEYRDEPQYLKTYIYRLRRKMEADPRHPRYILTHYGGGYRLANGDTDPGHMTENDPEPPGAAAIGAKK
ncbi:MAG: response regulator transcription factor [Dehalococcoidia bacterium]